MAKSVDSAFIGRWRITYMGLWDQDFIDFVVEGFIRFNKQGRGEFQFGTVHGFLTFQSGKHESKYRLLFKWEGSVEDNSATGRGWAEIDGDFLHGHIYIDGNEDSSFKAQRKD